MNKLQSVSSGGFTTYGQALQFAKDQLEANGIDNVSKEARMLVCHAFGIESIVLVGDGGRSIPPMGGALLEQYVARRIVGEPVSRITGTKEFYGNQFELSADTLDPRDDTGALLDEILRDRDFPVDREFRFLDIGTGSGAIAISLLKIYLRARAVASDISSEAISTARSNARLNQVVNRVEFVETTWCSNIDGEFDLIVSNPPYIRSECISELSREVRNHDPLIALDGGKDGGDAYRKILEQSSNMLAARGKLFLEIGYDQAALVRQIGINFGWTPVSLAKDLGGNDRVLIFERT